MSDTFNELGLDPSEQDEVLTKLNIWATGHQTPHQAFMARMGRTFSPLEFYDVVRRALADEPPISDADARDLAFGRGYGIVSITRGGVGSGP